MGKLKYTLLAASALFMASSFGQCYDDECDDNNDISIPGCCTGNTTGATWSGYGDIDCANMWYDGTSNGNPDVWMSFTAPTTGFIEITLDNITQSGPTSYYVFDHQNAEVCASLNSFGLLAGVECHNLPGDGVGGTTALDTIQYAVEAGERYWILLSADVENGATTGTFELCIDVVAPPPPPPPAPGTDCTTAAVLCNGDPFAQGSFSGVGLVEEISQNSCFGADERQSKWYTFTASQSGTFEWLIDPVTNTDDYDWAIWNTTGGCYPNTNLLMEAPIACNWSGCPGNTGISTADPCTVIDFDCQGNPNDCNSTQLETTAINLVAGETYTILIDNFTVSGNGFSTSFGGSAVMSPQQTDAIFNSTLNPGNCEADFSSDVTAIPNYTYTWDYGDGNTATGSTPPTHTYTDPGTYIVTMTVTDALGCTQTSSQIIDVADCTPLPVELISFEATLLGDHVSLNWITASEINNDHFKIEKSTDLTNWEIVKVVQGVGTTDEEQSYYAFDREPHTGTSYYRLTQVDINGEMSYESIRTVNYNRVSEKEIVRKTNMAGQEVQDDYKGVVIYFYSDGSKETIVQ